MATSETTPRPVSALKQARLDLGLRQADVAAEAGCAVSLVSMAESGYQPAEHRRDAIAAAVGASAGSFW